MNLEPPSRRPTTRRVLRYIAAGLTALIILLAIKFIALVAFDHLGRKSMDENKFEQAKTYFSLNLIANFFDPWQPHFNTGVAQFKLHDFQAAEKQFRLALDQAPDDKVCMVSLNLAVTLETRGDGLKAMGDLQGAQQLYGEASMIATKTECRSNSGSSNSSSSDSKSNSEPNQKDIKERIEKKKQEVAQDTQDMSDQPMEDTPQTEDKKLQDLKDTNSDAEQAKQSHQDKNGASGPGKQEQEPQW
ncbi:hypothetical protein O6R08_10380 [Cutibacterium equinum]|uniref:Tetratricopeptide repeat protein n=1 Tax=Cutibacterium equinum TaxID=3016342 RepID=A0ABY7QXR9_9ACTN|nr:hypothetical protein [Cutibacterium equinum]WCC79851.1 hypothetical protein O6R08_10380 [Cutibacterium equinum]